MLAQRPRAALPSALVAVRLGDVELMLHPAGAAFAPECGTLVVADLHLEKAVSFATRRQLLPPHETRDTLARLAALVMELAPRRLVLLGDSFHSPHHSFAADPYPLAMIADLAARCDLVWLAGNHDPELPLPLPGCCAPELALGAVTLRHLPGGEALPEIVGHLHPCARLPTRAGTQRKKCFLLSQERLILPAFGTLTGGLDAAEPAISALFPEKAGHAFLAAGGRLHRVPLAAVL